MLLDDDRLVGITTPELRIDQNVFALLHYIYRLPPSSPSSSSTPQDNPDASSLYPNESSMDSPPELSDKMMIEAVVHVDNPGSIQIYADAHRSRILLFSLTEPHKKAAEISFPVCRISLLSPVLTSHKESLLTATISVEISSVTIAPPIIEFLSYFGSLSSSTDLPLHSIADSALTHEDLPEGMQLRSSFYADDLLLPVSPNKSVIGFLE